MSDSRYWSKKLTTDFIEIYRAHPCLWKIRSKEYTNKNLKNEAYDTLITLCKTAYPEANRDFVVKKIQSLRGSFRKELKKISDSKRTGTSIDDIYVPSLWYFELLMFTRDHELPSSSISNLTDTEATEVGEDERDADEEQEEAFSPSEAPVTQILEVNNATSSEVSN